MLPLQAADFNGDGLNDLLLLSHQAVYGYQQVNSLLAQPPDIGL